MKTLKLFFACAGLLAVPFALISQQPVNESQTQADQIRNKPPSQANVSLRPPIHILHLNSRLDAIADTIEVLPGQKLQIGNDAFAWIRVFSDYPFSINVYGCNAPATKDITCEIMPSLTIKIQDMRTGVPAYSGPVAHLHITALKHTP